MCLASFNVTLAPAIAPALKSVLTLETRSSQLIEISWHRFVHKIGCLREV